MSGVAGIPINSSTADAGIAHDDDTSSDTDGTPTPEPRSAPEPPVPPPTVTAAIPFTAAYTFSTLDYPCFPTKGYYARVTNTVVLPLRGGTGDTAAGPLPAVYDVAQVDFSAVIPVSPQITLAANIFAGSDVTGNLADIPTQMPTFGFNTFDRSYFPQIAGKQAYGAHKGAAAVTLQFHPWTTATILGGQLFFSATAACGQVAARFSEFDGHTLLWNTSIGAGFRVADAFGVQIRFGAGTREYTDSPVPFVALDIGNFRL
jgi:NTE family protein